MNRNLTVSVRSILVTALVVLALGVSYLLGGSAGGPAPASAADGPAGPATPRRLLTMTGTGEAGAVPDQLSFTLAVGVTRTDLDDALAGANATMSRVLKVLAGHDVERADVQTTGLSMTPVYAYHSYAPPTISGYRVSQRASVLVRDLSRGGAAVSAAVDAGGNAVRVSGIRLLVGDSDAVMARARDAAVAEATAKARQYAAASGQELGEVVTLREVRTRALPTSSPQHLAVDRRSMAADLAAVPIRAGRDRGSVTVQVVWELA